MSRKLFKVLLLMVDNDILIQYNTNLLIRKVGQNMKRFIFKITSFLLTSILALSILPVTSIKASSTSSSIQEIKNMVTAINDKDWETYTQLMTNERQSFFNNYFNDDSITTGVKQIKSLELDSIIKVDKELAQPELLLSEFPILGTSDKVETYIVILDCNVTTENEFFYNGINYFLVALANEDGEMKVAQFNRPSYPMTDKVVKKILKADDIKYNRKMAGLSVLEFADHGLLVNENGDFIVNGFEVKQIKTTSLLSNTDYSTVRLSGLGYVNHGRGNGFKVKQGNKITLLSDYTDHPALSDYHNYYSLPKGTIDVLLNITGNNAIVHPDFVSYIKNTLPNEWFPSWHSNSLTAGAYCVKGVGWYRKIKPVDTSYNVSQGTQRYIPNTALTVTDNIFNSMTNTYMVNSSYCVFFPEYGAGTEGVIGTAGSERLLQWGSQALATQSPNPYNYTQILNYYYAGTRCSSGNVSFVQIY